MNIYLLTFLGVTIPFLAGYYLGCADGKVEGRIETSKVDNYIDGAAYFAISGFLRVQENDLYV